MKSDIINKDLIKRLASLKREDEWWDFKSEWHSSKVDLVHDILCMSNQLSTHDGLLIIGVDENDNWKIKDVSNDKNRKTTQNIIDILRNLHFAGDCRPSIDVINVDMDGSNVVDVIRVYKSNKVPYYLTNDYKKDEHGKELNKYYVYTRDQDSNTPINASASFPAVEKLWATHFGLNLSPLQKVFNYLEDVSKWINSPMSGNSSERYYHRDFPEFVIEDKCDEEPSECEFYNFLQTDPSPSWYMVHIKYMQTVLFSAQAQALDGARYFTTIPQHGYLFLDACSNYWETENTFPYMYFVKESLEFRLHEFYKNKSSYPDEGQYKKFISNILVFDNYEEKEFFIKNISGMNKDELNNLINSECDLYIDPKIKNPNFYNRSYKTTRVLIKLLDDFRSNGIPKNNYSFSSS